MKLKDKLKKIKFKDVVFCFLSFIICFLITGGITVGATSLITSREVSYNNNTSNLDSENVQDAIDELWINNGCASSSGGSNSGTSFKVGDYISMTPTISSYTTEPKYTGYDTPETITPTELNLWRVIRVNSDGTIDAVSEYASSTNVTFKGKTGYQSFVGYLNILASKYENRKYTVGSRIMGYNGQTDFISDTSYFDGTSTKAVTDWASSISGTPAEEYLGRGDELYTTDYELVKAAYGGTSNRYAIAKKVGTSYFSLYWLGSRMYRHVFRYSSPIHHQFTGAYVGAGGDKGNDCLRYYRSDSDWGDSDDGSSALRPIITLRSGLTATGNGTSDNPYVLP